MPHFSSARSGNGEPGRCLQQRSQLLLEGTFGERFGHVHVVLSMWSSRASLFGGLSAAIRDSAKLQSPKERSAPIWVHMQTNVLLCWELSKELTPLSPSLFTAAGFPSRFWGHPGEKCQKGWGCPQQGQWPHCRDQLLYFQDQPHCCSPVRAGRGEWCCRGSLCTTTCIIKTCARSDFPASPCSFLLFLLLVALGQEEQAGAGSEGAREGSRRLVAAKPCGRRRCSAGRAKKHKSFVFRAANIRVFSPLLLQRLKAEQPQVQRWVRVLPGVPKPPAPKEEFGNVALLLKSLISRFWEKICSVLCFARIKYTEGLLALIPRCR